MRQDCPHHSSSPLTRTHGHQDREALAVGGGSRTVYIAARQTFRVLQRDIDVDFGDVRALIMDGTNRVDGEHGAVSEAAIEVEKVLRYQGLLFLCLAPPFALHACPVEDKECPGVKARSSPTVSGITSENKTEVGMGGTD